jgi:VCBS repeat-containing protein
VSGTAQANAAIQIFNATGDVIGSGFAGANGDFSIVLDQPLTNGEEVQVVQVNGIGDVSPPAVIFAPDFTAPDAPTATISPDGATVSGTGEAGAQIQIRNAAGSLLGTAQVGTDGTYTATLTTAQTNGQILQAVQVDGAGNVSPDISLTAPDTTLPDAPTATIDGTGSLVSGTGEAGATVEVRDSDGNVLGTALVDAQGNYTVTLSTAQVNGEALTVLQSDAAGNESPEVPITAPDITAPDAPTATIALDGATVSGTGEAGAQIQIRNALGTVIGTALVDTDGTYTATLTTPQIDGQILQAVQVDGGGNVSPGITLTAPDTTPPPAPTADIDNMGLVVTGTGVPGSTIEVRDADGTVLGIAQVNAQGDYAIVLDTPQEAGDTLDVFQLDAAGNESLPTPLLTPDLTAPDAPVAVITAEGDLITGTGEAGATVRVTDPSGTVIGTVLIGTDGTFSIPLNPAVVNGEQLQVVQVDPSGNISPETTISAPDLDGLPGPDAPTATINGDGDQVTGTGEIGAQVRITGPGGVLLGTGTVDGTGNYTIDLSTAQTNGEEIRVIQSNANGSSPPAVILAPDTTAPDAPDAQIDATGVVVVGGAEPGATITIRDAGGTIIGTGTANAQGDFVLELPSPLTNGEEISVTQTDGAGNESPPAQIFAPDITAPDAPTGTLDADGLTLTGTGEAGATVTVTDADGNVIGSAIVAGDGTYTALLDTAQLNGETLTLTQADGAGNISPEADIIAPDSTAPDAPVGTVSNDGLTISGTGEAGAIVSVTDPAGTVIATATVGANGAWSATLGAAQVNGETLGLTQTDAAGNISDPGSAIAPDITAPDAPTGAVSGDGETVTGTGEAGATVNILAVGGAVIGTALVDQDGTFTATLTPAQANGQALTLVQVDGAGNLSPTVALTAPDITAPDAPTGVVNASGTIITGTGEAGAIISVTDPLGTVIGTATVGGNGGWAATLTTAQTNGESLGIIQTDAAGNISDPGSAIAPDLTPPDAPTGTVSGDGLTVTGTGEAGATVRITDPFGSVIGTALVDQDGSFTATLSTAQINGEALGLRQTDAAGNPSPQVQITAPDITAPDAPTATISANGTTISGLGEAGATVTVTNLVGAIIGIALVAADGRYTVTLNPTQNNGQSLFVSQEDVAGNGSIAAGVTAPDLTAPDAPSALVNANGTVVTGVGEAGARVTIVDESGTAIGSALVAGDGSYSVTLTQPQANGQTIGAYQTDGAGNVSTTTDAIAPDITPPPPPAALVVSGDGLTLTGIGEVGARVEVRDAGGTLIGSALVGADGRFTVTFSTAQIGGQDLVAVQVDAAGNISDPAAVDAPFDVAAFNNSDIALVDLLPVTSSVNHGTVGYVALVSAGLLDLDAQVLGTQFLPFNVAAGHTQLATFTYNATLTLGLGAGYAVHVQRLENGVWVDLNGNAGEATLLNLSLLGGDLVSSQELTSGAYRAFVTFEGAVGVGLLGSLGVTGVDSDYTDIGSIVPQAAQGNVITDPSPDGHVDVVSPQTVVQSVTVNGVTTAITADGTVVNGLYGRLVIDRDGDYTYTPNASAAVIGHTDVFTYTLFEPNGSDTSQATLSIAIGSDDITGAPVALNDVSEAAVQYANVVQNVAQTQEFTFNTAGTLLAPVTGRGSDSFSVAANSEADITITVIRNGLLSVLPSYTITVFNAAGTVVATHTETAVAGLLQGTGIVHTFADMPTGNYTYSVSSTNILGTGYGSTVYIAESITHFDQFTVTGVTGSSGELLANDNTGTAFATVRVGTSSGFVEVGDTPLTVVGAHGTLIVNETGGYTYTPSSTLAHSTVDLVDSFTYQIVQPNGTLATARLDVTIDVGSGTSSAMLMMADGSEMTAAVHDDGAVAAAVTSDDVLGQLAYDMFEGQGALEHVLANYLDTPGDNAAPLDLASTPVVDVQTDLSTTTPDDPLAYLSHSDDLDQLNANHNL